MAEVWDMYDSGFRAIRHKYGRGTGQVWKKLWERYGIGIAKLCENYERSMMEGSENYWSTM